MQSINEILQEIKERKLNVSKIARDTGIPVQRFHKWMRGENLPKTVDARKLEVWAADNLEESINMVSEAEPLMMMDAPKGYGQKVDVSPKSFHNLTEIGIILAESNKILALANKQQSDNSAILIAKYIATGGADPENHLNVQATLQALQEYLSELSAQVNKTTVAKTAAELGTRMVQKKMALGKKGSHAGERK